MPSYDPEKRRIANRRKYERLKADPQKYQEFLAKQKAARQKRRVEGVAKVPRQPTSRAKLNESGRIYKLKPQVKSKRRNWERQKMDRLATRPRPEVCENCHTVGKRGVVFDHDHTTGQFRGWLCDNCNRALGLLNDDMERILGLALYLEHTGAGRKASHPLREAR